MDRMTHSLKITATGLVTLGTIQVQQFEWSGSGSSGDTLLIVDNNGKVVWAATAAGTPYDLYKSYGRPAGIQGLSVTTLSSGTLVIYYV